MVPASFVRTAGMIDRASDAALVGRVLAGDSRAAGTLYDRHWRGAWRAAVAVLGSAAEAEDVATEAWLRAIDALEQCQPRDRFGPWLRRIAVNRAIDVVRRGRRLSSLDDLVGITAEAPEDPDRGIREAVARLPLERRVVVALRFWADLSVPAIAELLEIPVGTATSRLARGLADLRVSIEEVAREH
jgi:RNA polymerase sigma-70 factor, ECF subfamily